MLKFWKKKGGEPQDSADAAVDSATDADAPIATSDAHVDGKTPVDEVVAELASMGDAEASHAQQPDTQQPDTPQPDTLPTAATGKRRWRDRLGGSVFSRNVGSLFVRNPRLDDNLLDDLETSLISADVGVTVGTRLVDDLRERMHKREFADADALREALRQALLKIVEPLAQPLDVSTAKPFVVLMVGVNGVGKTTTVGKLARLFRAAGRQVLLAAGDTFRAAAVEQLKAWGERNDVAVIAQGQGADSASVVFDALQAARARGSDVLIADTAGRLHTQGGLMDELSKVRRVLSRLDAGAPHEVLLVLDGGTGQNAINQVRQFREAAGVTGLVVTKLDGTAKGGVVFALAGEFGLPIRYIGLGEGIDDLCEFDPQAFVDGLLPATTEAAV